MYPLRNIPQVPPSFPNLTWPAASFHLPLTFLGTSMGVSLRKIPYFSQIPFVIFINSFPLIKKCLEILCEFLIHILLSLRLYRSCIPLLFPPPHTRYEINFYYINNNLISYCLFVQQNLTTSI